MSGGSIASKVVLFCFLSLLLFIIAWEIKKKYKIPVYLNLLILGALLKLISGMTADLASTVEIVNGSIAPVIQLAIVPAIIFEAAFATDWYTLKKQIGQILLLSSTVLFLSAVLTAVAFKYILQYPYSFQESLILGFILSCSDHVAVKSNIRDLHTNEKLGNLINGETLLNEAIVLVFFKVIRDGIVKDGSFVSVAEQFIRHTLGGIAMSLVFSLFMSLWLKRMVNDYRQETSLTIVTPYLLYWVGFYEYVDFSGPLSVMCLGLFMSAYGKILISPTVEKQLHYVWAMVTQNSQALVFVIAGMILETVLVRPGSIFSIKNFGLMGVLFILIHLIRGIAMLIHYPILKRFGYGITIQETFVLSMAGVKGVICSLLALIAFNDESLDSDFRATALFFTINIVALSICIDSLLLRLTINKFKMNNFSSAQESILLGAARTIIKSTDKKIRSFANSHTNVLIKWDEILELAGPKMFLTDVMDRTRIGKKILKENNAESVEGLAELYNERINVDNDSLEWEMRRRFYNVLKGVYWNCFELGECSGSSALKLMDSCSRALDRASKDINDWNDLQKTIYDEKKMLFYKKYTNHPIIGRYFRAIIYRRIIKAYDVAHTFVRAHYSAEKIIDSMKVEIDDRIAMDMMEEAHSQIVQCQEFIKEFITDTYPEIIADVQTKMSTYILINRQRKMINKIYSQGLVKELEYKNLLGAIDSNFKLLTFRANPHIPTLEEMLKGRFKKSSDDDIRKILPLIEEKHYQPNTVLFNFGEPAHGAYLIFSGTINEYSTSIINYNLGIDNIAGAYCLIDNFQKEYVTSAVTTTVVIAALIPVSALKAECFIEDIYNEASKVFILHQKAEFGLSEANEEHIERVVENSKLWYLQAGAPANLRRGALVLKGRLRKDKEIYSLLRPCKKIIETLDDCVLLVFPPHFGGILKQHRQLSDAFARYFIKHPSRHNKKCIENYIIVSKFKFNDFEDTSEDDE